MDLATIANTFVPLSAAVTSFVVVSLCLYNHKESDRSLSVRVLLLYFGCCIVNWSAIFLYFYLPNVFVVLNSLIFFSFVIVQVLFYYFLFLITRIDAEERFSRTHFIIPFSIALFLSILMVATPAEYQLQSVLGRGKFTGGSYLFFAVSNSKMPVRLFFSVVYTVLSFVRLYRYRGRVENYSANYDKSSLGWVRTYLVLSVSLVPIPLMGIILPRGEAAASGLLTIQNMIILFQYAFLSFHVVKQNFIYFDRSVTQPYRSKQVSISTDSRRFVTELVEEESKERFTREEFERFMLKEKPYLNPDLRLIDLAAPLNTNRTYLSAFINREYGVNFSRLINSYRLRELEILKGESSNNGVSEKELSEIVGFGSYRNYKRFVGQD